MNPVRRVSMNKSDRRDEYIFLPLLELKDFVLDRCAKVKSFVWVRSNWKTKKWNWNRKFRRRLTHWDQRLLRFLHRRLCWCNNNPVYKYLFLNLESKQKKSYFTTFSSFEVVFLLDLTEDVELNIHISMTKRETKKSFPVECSKQIYSSFSETILSDEISDRH